MTDPQVEQTSAQRAQSSNPLQSANPRQPAPGMNSHTISAPAPRLWTGYVAIGDSFTEGMNDAHPSEDNVFVGWADRLAGLLAARASAAGSEFRYANLAIRGRLLNDIVQVQTPAALDLGPDLVSIVGGGNDILRPRADLDAKAAQLESAVARIRATGADVLMATPTDPKGAPLLGAVRGRNAEFTAHVWSIARRHGAHVIDLWGLAALRDWRMWGDDRIHLTAEGHRRVALAAYAALGLDPAQLPDGAGEAWAQPLPPAPPISRVDSARSTAQWMGTHVRPWVHRRLTGRSSGDTVSAKRPELLTYDRSPAEN